MSFEKASWIWHSGEYAENEYAEIYETVEYSDGPAVLRVSVSGDYTLFINGVFVSSNQYGDFPHYKVYDEIDITAFLKNGENTICFLAWYFGKSGMRYVASAPGLIYEIEVDNKVVAYSSETGTYFIQEKCEKPTELANALAVFAGIAEGDAADEICEKLAKGELETCSLSMKVFKYDALIKVNKEKYKDCILDEIRKTYKVMLDAGSTTVWETIEGATAFENAGSLCHGWSAVPVHYYHLLLE